MIQNIIVGLIVAAAAVYAGYSVYLSVMPGKKPQNACGGCTGCDLKNIKNKCDSPEKFSTLETKKIPYPKRQGKG
jgi:hypothetical protein